MRQVFAQDDSVSSHWPAPAVRLDAVEHDRLLCAIEAGLRVANPGDFVAWIRGRVGALLPHQVLVCLLFDADGGVTRVESVHGSSLAPHLRQALAGGEHSLAVRLARHVRQGAGLPALADADDPATAPPQLLGELTRTGVGNALLHGSGRTAEGTAVFVMFGLAEHPRPRHAYLLGLLLPCLHLALARLPAAMPAARLARPLSARETEIVRWLRYGKTNEEMGAILGISALTVKNHLQRIYRALGVANRAHALARCIEWRLIAD